MISLKDNIWDYLSACAAVAMPELVNTNVLIDSQVYWVRQNVDMPDHEPFVTLDITQSRKTGHESRIVADEDDIGVELLKTHRQVDVVVDVYGVDAFDKALEFQDALHHAEMLEVLRASKLGIVDVGIVNDISAVVDTVWSGRANFTITFSYLYVRERNVPTINHVPINGDVYSSPGVEIEMVVDGPNPDPIV